MFKKLIEMLYLRQEGNLAYYDSLTGINNRTYYDRVIRPRYCTRECYVTYIDVDNLKGVNDRFGHNAGDELIVGVADQLKAFKPLEICRIGGDEFIMISFKDIEAVLEGASIGTYKKGRYEDISNGVKHADERMQLNKDVSKSIKKGTQVSCSSARVHID